jgi:hypothetical protein
MSSKRNSSWSRVLQNPVFFYLVKKFPAFYGAHSLPHSQEPVANPYLEPDKFKP